MKICAIICEFNPFHNGHKYLLSSAKALTGCDAVLCIMSGSFTQRGEMCVLDKHDRARHAVLGGADCVIELPAAFSVAPAEIFASGAVKVLAQIPEVNSLIFGCESGGRDDFIRAARAAADENEIFKSTLSRYLDEGESYIRSYAAAFERVYGDSRVISSPNNLLGVEYTKAILKTGANIEIYPVKRLGAGHSDGSLSENFSSANAIRSNLSSPLIKSNVPEYVFNDLVDEKSAWNDFRSALRNKLYFSSEEQLRQIFGCGEGLENRLKKLAYLPFEELIARSTSKRYPSSRVRRILCANLLGITAADCKEYLGKKLAIDALAVKKERADELLPILAANSGKSEIAEKCAETDRFSYEVWRYLHNLPKKNNFTVIV